MWCPLHGLKENQEFNLCPELSGGSVQSPAAHSSQRTANSGAYKSFRNAFGQTNAWRGVPVRNSTWRSLPQLSITQAQQCKHQT